jgi:polar amino acid transport system substrate-binding protein
MVMLLKAARARNVAVAFLLALSAYGGGSHSALAAGQNAAERDANAGMADANTAKADPAAAAMLPARIRQAGVLVIGAELQQTPADFFSADGTTPVGWEVDLAHALGIELGLKIKYLQMPFGSLITSLKAGRVDMTMSAMNDTRSREQAIDFVDFFNAGIGMLVQKGNPDKIDAPDDLCGKGVSVQSGTTQEAFAEAQSARCKAAGKRPVTIVVSSSAPEQEQSLRTGRFAAIIEDTPSASFIAQVAGKGQYFEMVNYPPINGGPYGIGVAKDNPDLTKAVQAAMQQLMTSGVYHKILSDWGLTSGASKKATVNAG